jgi:hypothetical protein
MMFDAPLFNGPRTWKYFLPGALVVLLIPVVGKMLISPDPETRYWTIIPFGLGCLFFIMFLVNLWKYMAEFNTEQFSEHQSALSRTPLVMLAEAMKQMHPEAVRVLNRFGVRTSWEVSVNAQTYERDWILAGTNAHFGFVEHVLSRSGKTLYPKRSFPDGSKKWDPDHIVEDREQYDDLEQWMFARMMITRSHGDFKPAEFIPPWTPKFVLEAMGLTGEQDLYRPEEEPRKDLDATPLSSGTKTSPQMGGNGNGSNGKKALVEPELSDAEWQTIQDEMVDYSERIGTSNLKGVAQ